MANPQDLRSLRWALLQHPGDPLQWQNLIDLIQALGGGLLLADLDGLFEERLVTPDVESAANRNQALEEGLEAHRAGDIHGVQRAVKVLEVVEPDGAWTHAIQGLLAEMVGTCGYAAFSRALERDRDNEWFCYWVGVAALRRRDWLDFAHHALLLSESGTLEHQLLVFAAVHHLIAAALVVLAPESCRANDLRVLDLVHPDAIPHDRDGMAAHVLRFMDKERRKMLRVILAELVQPAGKAGGRWPQLNQLHQLLHWRVVGLTEPRISMDLYAAIQRHLNQNPDPSLQPGDLTALLPRRPDLSFGDDHVQVWRDFRLLLLPSS